MKSRGILDPLKGRFRAAVAEPRTKKARSPKGLHQLKDLKVQLRESRDIMLGMGNIQTFCDDIIPHGIIKNNVVKTLLMRYNVVIPWFFP